MTLKEWVNKDFLNFFNVIKRRFADKTEVDALSQEIYKELEKYVQKVEGKGLSANDFTDELKKKLEDLMDRAQLDEALKGINDLIEELQSGGVEGIIDTLNEIKEFLSGYNEGDNLLQIIKETVEEVTNNYTELVESTKTEINNTIETTKEEINSTIDDTKAELEQKIKEGDDKLDAKIDETKTTLEGELNTAKEELDGKIDSTKSELESTITSTNQATRDWADEKFVTELGTREDFITWTKNGEVHDLTVPFAEHATNANHATTADSAGNVNWTDVESHPTTLEGYGITDGFNKVSVVGEGNAITTGSGEGHTITLTKGNTFVLKSELGTTVPTLVDGKIPTDQLPGYVDDVLEYPTSSDFPKPGESGKIYVSQDTNITYRWGGTEYVEISKSLALGDTSSTAFSGDRGKALEDALNGFKASISGKTITITINGVSQTITLPDPTWGDVTGKPSTLPNQYSLKAGSKTYNGSADVTITAADLGVSTTAEADAKYVKKAGDTMTGTLTIAPSTPAAGLILNKTNYWRFIQFKESNTNKWDVAHGGSSGKDTYLTFRYNGIDNVTFASSGNVGIGTIDPNAKLYVNGNAYIKDALTVNNSAIINGELRVGHNADGPNVISFYGTTGDSPGYYAQSFIAERRYADVEQSELVLFKGNDRDSANADRIRHVAHQHLFQTYNTTLLRTSSSAALNLGSDVLTDICQIDTNGVTATKFIKKDGTSSQFLKADGSVDSNTYLTTTNASSTYVTKTDAGKYVTTDTAQTVSGVKTFSSTQSFTNTTKPFSVTSTALVNNLNADLLDGKHSTDFALKTDLSSYVTLNTEQTITSEKKFAYNLIMPANDAVGCARGFIFQNNGGTRVVGGIGAFSQNGIFQYNYIGWGNEPWLQANSLQVSSSSLNYKGNDVYHAGNLKIADYQKKVPIVQQGSTTSLTAAWDTKYVFSAAVTGTLNITFATKPSDTYDHYIIIIFKAGASKPTITFPNTVKFGETLSVEANETVEINITLGNSTVGEYLGLWKAYKG